MECGGRAKRRHRFPTGDPRTRDGTAKPVAFDPYDVKNGWAAGLHNLSAPGCRWSSWFFYTAPQWSTCGGVGDIAPTLPVRSTAPQPTRPSTPSAAPLPAFRCSKFAPSPRQGAAGVHGSSTLRPNGPPAAGSATLRQPYRSVWFAPSRTRPLSQPPVPIPASRDLGLFIHRLVYRLRSCNQTPWAHRRNQ